MVTKTLVREEIQEGRRILEALDSGGFEVTAALWLYQPDWEEWRLTLASPHVDTGGPLAAYTRLDSILRRIEPPTKLSVENIRLVGPRDRFIQLLRRAIKAPGISEIRFSRNVVENVYVEDALIYRLT